MPSRYTIDEARGIIRSTVGTTISNEDVLDHSRRLAEDPAFNPDYDHLVDASAVRRVLVNATGVRIAADCSPFSARSHRAFVCTRPVVVGLVRMFELLQRRSKRIRIFGSVEEAEAWLAAVKSSRPPGR